MTQQQTEHDQVVHHPQPRPQGLLAFQFGGKTLGTRLRHPSRQTNVDKFKQSHVKQ